MPLFKYSVAEEKGEKWGKAQLHDVNCSYKDLGQVLAAIKGKSVKEAEKILNEAIALKKAIPFKKFNTGMGHRSELCGQKGKYPKKECRFALELLENARANSVARGLDEAVLFIKHACAYKQNVLKRYRRTFAGSRTLGYGKQALWSNYMTCRAELVLAEKPGAAKEEKKRGKEKQKGKNEVKAEAKHSGAQHSEAQEHAHAHSQEHAQAHAPAHEHQPQAHAPDHAHVHAKENEKQ